jgi:RNA polymerase sigma-70 factor, ECF subfamily
VPNFFGNGSDRLDIRGMLDRMSGQGDHPNQLARGAVSLTGGLAGHSSTSASAPISTHAAVEQDLVAQARAGDQDAFASIVRLHQRQVYQLAVRMLHNQDDAVEATQDVFLAAWQGLHSFRGEARLSTWLYRIAYNHCLKVAEVRQRDEQTRAELATATAKAEEPAAKLSALHAQSALGDLCERVRAEVASLPPKYRAVLALRHSQDLSYEEMAEVLRVPIGTVKTHLFRARALLKERLTDLDRAASDGVSRAGELGAGLYGLLGRQFQMRAKEDGQ